MSEKEASVFDTKNQHSNLDSKIIVAFEKISEVYRTLQWGQAQLHKMSPIQLQILIFIRHHSIDKCKVGYMSREFNVTKATISDSVKTLLKKGLLSKQADRNDSRSFTLALSAEGEELTKKLEAYTEPLKQPVFGLNDTRKEVLFQSLTELIYKLQRNGIIDVYRMCYSCKHYSGDKDSTHFCELMKTKLANVEIRMDCAEHEALL